jgi:hypothetical protein
MTKSASPSTDPPGIQDPSCSQTSCRGHVRRVLNFQPTIMTLTVGLNCDRRYDIACASRLALYARRPASQQPPSTGMSLIGWWACRPTARPMPSVPTTAKIESRESFGYSLQISAEACAAGHGAALAAARPLGKTGAEDTSIRHIDNNQ